MRHLGGDIDEKFVVSGSSAGGHIISAALLNVLKHEEFVNVRAAVLFYPSVDPRDRHTATASLPFHIPPIRYRSGTSCMGWYFEDCVLKGDRNQWISAEVIPTLQDDIGIAQRWPCTLIIHGRNDSVVPIDHSEALLEVLAAAALVSDGVASENAPRKDVLIRVRLARHNFESSPSAIALATFDGVLAFLGGIMLRSD